MSWRSEKGYSAAGARPPQLDYLKMFFLNAMISYIKEGSMFLEGFSHSVSTNYRSYNIHILMANSDYNSSDLFN